MPSLKRSVIGLALGGVLLSSNLVFAEQCFENSPNLTKLKDRYYDLDKPVELTKSESKELQLFLKKMTGHWQGQYVDTECRGTDNAPKYKIKNKTVNAQLILTLNDNIQVNAELYDVKSKQRQNQSFNFLHDLRLFSFKLTDANTLSFSTLLRQRLNSVVAIPLKRPISEQKPKSRLLETTRPISEQKPKSRLQKPKSRLLETIYHIEHKGKQLSIIRSYYSNGVYIGNNEWVMKRN